MELTLQEKRKLIEFFEFLLDKEVSKPLGEINSEAVDNYVKILLDLQDKHVELSPEYIDEQVRKIFHPEDFAKPETAKTTKKRYSKNKIWLVAACVAILVALFSILSFSSEKSVKDVLEDFFGTFEFIPFGEEVDVDNETYGKGNNSKHYSSIAELVKNEKVNLLYPIDIDKKIELISVSKIDEKKTVKFSYINSDLSLTIKLNAKIPQRTKDFCNKKITLNGIDYYLCTMKDISQTQAYFIHNNNLYTIITTTENDLMDILNNMEEIDYED